MTIRIATDSTCDLDPTVADRLGIGVIPCYINIDDESYLDGMDISREAFYERLPHLKRIPKTSAAGIGIFAATYNQLVQAGASEIISLHIHSGLSNLSGVARLAGDTISQAKVSVMEVGQFAIGLGFLAMAGAEAAGEGKSADEVAEAIHNEDQRTYIYAALDTVDYLRESGHVPSLAAGIANLLHIKPIIRLHKGEVSLAGQTRTGHKGIDWLTAAVKRHGRLKRLAVLHTHAPQKADALAEQLKAALGWEAELMVMEVTPVLGVHVGPNGVGVALVEAGD